MTKGEARFARMIVLWVAVGFEIANRPWVTIILLWIAIVITLCTED